MLVGADGVHAAGVRARAHVVLDGVVGAGVEAHAAVDALLLVDVGLLVLEGDGALGADLAAGVGEAALAAVGHAVGVVRARVARELDDVDERRLVVGLGHGGLREALGEALAVVDALQRQAHGEADALLDDGALEEDRLAVGGDVAGDDLVREVTELAAGGLLVVLPHVVGDLCHAGEHVAADLGQVGVHATHGVGHRCPSPGWCHTEPAPSPQRAQASSSIAQRGRGRGGGPAVARTDPGRLPDARGACGVHNNSRTSQNRGAVRLGILARLHPRELQAPRAHPRPPSARPRPRCA